ncbi:F-box-like domain-containing protein [Apiospora marii]|uniref:F-box-like domain-containing protein n=1 Tax=Apiospora marii TaxID=335849 RepID=A0ABR1T2T7_9PEZI
MDRLPREVKEQILRLALDDRDEDENWAGSIATVSRDWQTLVEPITFKSLHLTQECLGEALADGILTPARQAYINSISLTTKLPYYYFEGKTLESAKEQNNLSFSKAVTDLLGLLSAWPSKPCGLRLALFVDFVDYESYAYDEGYAPGLSCSFTYGFISLREDFYHQLPEVPCVTEFVSYAINFTSLSIIPKSCCKIASRFPNLQHIHWKVKDGRQNHSFQMTLRRDFATGISMLPRSVRKLSLVCDDNGQPTVIQSSIYPRETQDPLSTALRKFSKQLECLSLTIIAGPELFFDPDGDRDEGCWPLLRKVKVALALRTPWGEPIFNFDFCNPGVNVNSPEAYRIVPISERVNQYCLAFARAAARMPKLKTMNIQWRTSTKSNIEYTIDPDSSGAQFLSISSPGLDLTGEIQEAWWKAALVHLREGAQFHFVVMDNGERFKHRNRWPFSFGLRVDVPEPEPFNLIEWTRSEV